MITIDITGIILLLGIPTALTGFCVGMIERHIQKREKKQEELEKQREQLEILIVQGIGASIAGVEAIEKAVQRIPDAHCNGDMHAAVDYATKAKHELKTYLIGKGVSSIFE